VSTPPRPDERGIGRAELNVCGGNEAAMQTPKDLE
jgi:hypothetical protein